MSTQTAAVVNNNLSNGFSILKKKKRTSDTVLRVLIIVCALIAVALIAGIIIYVVIRGVPVLLSNPNFLIGQRSFLQGTYGILPNIINTLYIIVITLIIATPIGVGSAIFLNEYAKPGKLVKIIEFTTETLSGIPSILFGLFGMVFFGNVLGMGTSILCGCLTLPLMILVVLRTASYYMLMKSTVQTIRDEEYITVARSKGFTQGQVLRRHVLKNALCPYLTSVCMQFGHILGGSMLVEVVFSWKGMGTLIYDSVNTKDFPMLQTCFLFIGICVVLSNLLADILNMCIDPRIREEGHHA